MPVQACAVRGCRHTAQAKISLKECGCVSEGQTAEELKQQFLAWKPLQDGKQKSSTQTAQHSPLDIGLTPWAQIQRSEAEAPVTLGNVLGHAPQHSCRAERATDFSRPRVENITDGSTRPERACLTHTHTSPSFPVIIISSIVIVIRTTPSLANFLRPVISLQGRGYIG